MNIFSKAKSTLAAVAAAAAFSAAAAPVYQATLTVRGYAGASALANFPVLVRISPTTINGFSYEDCAADGSDIRFADAAGGPLDFELETWNTSGESLAWVRLPTLEKDTFFTMTWKDDDPAAHTAASTWSGGYVGVWHMNEVDGAVADATGHGLTATPQGATASSIAVTGAPTGTGRQSATAAGGKGYLSVPNYDSFAAGDSFTMSGWVRLTSINGSPRIFSRKDNYTDANGWEWELKSGTWDTLLPRGAGSESLPTTVSSLQNAWVHLVTVFDGTSVSVYSNGSLAGTKTLTKGATDNGKALSFGNKPNGSSSTYLRGEYDECRLLNAAASADWVKAEYDTVASAAFLNYGPARSDEGGTTLLISGSPKAVLGDYLSPAYGAQPVDPKGTLVCTAPDGEIEADEGSLATCAGWRLYSLDGGGRTLEDWGDETSFTFVNDDDVPHELEWQWQIEYKVTGEATSFGHVEPDEQWVLHGEGATVTAVADSAIPFVGWAGDTEDTTTSGNDLVFASVTEPRTVRPVFANRDVHVTRSGSDEDGDGTEGSPFASLQKAVDSLNPLFEAGFIEDATVTLGAGTYPLDGAIELRYPVSVVGPGWDSCVLKQTKSGSRVVSLAGGASVTGVTLTGGNLSESWGMGAGALVYDGTISRCCISNNAATGYNVYGGGVRIFKGEIDHSIIAFNQAGTKGTGFGGGIGYSWTDNTKQTMGPVTIDTCLVYGNTAKNDGGGVYSSSAWPHDNMLTICNTTIADNVATGKGGGVYSSRGKLALVNDILSDNTAESGANYYLSDGVIDEVAAATEHCFFGNGTAKLGETSVSGYQVDFKDAANGDYRLKASSQAAAVGAWYSGIPDDLDGTVRKEPKTAAGCYECTEIDPGVIQLNPVTVTASTVSAELAGSIASLGEGTSAAVTLRYGLSAAELTEEKTACGIVTDFAFTLAGLTHATHYFYAVTVENDVGRTASVSGDFYTQYDPSIALEPSDDPAQNTEKLNAALTAAAPTQGTVTLGEGDFAINDELAVGSGVTLAGQGWEKTALRQTAAGKRVLTLDGGATLKGVTVTGGSLSGGNKQGGGAFVADGTISWCCISNNQISVGNSNYGGGVFLKNGRIDHSIVVDNSVQTTTGNACLGGGIGCYDPLDGIMIDTCLVRGNRAMSLVHEKPTVRGGGIGINFFYKAQAATIRNTTVVGNSAGMEGNLDASRGGAVATDCPGLQSQIRMYNCIVADNVTEGTNTTVHLDSSSGSRDVDHCLFDREDDKYGADSRVGDPLFKDAANGDYRLFYDSPANGIGYWYEGIAVDLDGHKRTRRPEAGCYEICPGFMLMVR